MADSLHTPQYEAGDRVRVVGLANAYRGSEGIVVDVIQPVTGKVYRYRVRFSDETTAVFFGFELEGKS